MQSLLPATAPDCTTVGSGNCTCRSCGEYFHNPFKLPVADAKCLYTVTITMMTVGLDATTCSNTLSESVANATKEFLASVQQQPLPYDESVMQPAAVEGSFEALTDCQMAVSGWLVAPRAALRAQSFVAMSSWSYLSLHSLVRAAGGCQSIHW